MKNGTLLFILILLGSSSFATTSDFELREYALKKSCQGLLTSTSKIVSEDTPIQTRRFFWQDRKIKREIKDIMAIAPANVKLVRPEARPGDKDLLFSSELGRCEDGYVIVLLKDGTFKIEIFNGKFGHMGIQIGHFIDATAKILLELQKDDRLNQASLIIMAHTHPSVAAYELGIMGIPNEFSDGDLYGFNTIKAYFESYGFYFPIRFETIFSSFHETGKFGDHNVAKKGLLYPERITDLANPIHFSDDPEKQKSTVDHLNWLVKKSEKMNAQARLEKILSMKD